MAEFTFKPVTKLKHRDTAARAPALGTTRPRATFRPRGLLAMKEQPSNHALQPGLAWSID
jgi:hypothetical protein